MKKVSTSGLLQEGTVLGNRYRIGPCLGRGAAGAVYRARDEALDLEVALKVLHWFAMSESNEQRFFREVQLLRKISHPNVIKTFDVGRSDEIIYFTMEYVEGCSLEDTDLDIAELLPIFAEISDGIAAIHEAEIVHRDIKPSNILVSKDASARIFDFGVARPAESNLTQQGEILGSASYIAPEIWLGKTVTGSVDLYALGVVMYQMLTRTQPFDVPEPARLMWLHVKEVPPPPVEVRAEIPQWLSTLIMDLLAKSPDDRPASAKVVAERIRAELKAAPKAAVKPAAERRTSLSSSTAEVTAADFDDGADYDLPAAPLVCDQVRAQAALPEIDPAMLAEVLANDPVLALEIVSRVAKISTEPFRSENPLRACMQALSAKDISLAVSAVERREALPNATTVAAFERLRIMSKCAAVVAQVLAAALEPEQTHGAKFHGLFAYLGDMVACVLYGYAYKSKHLDLEELKADYLELYPIPSSVVAPAEEFTRDAVACAREVVTAFAERHQWPTYRSLDSLPQESKLRSLGLNKVLYKAIFSNIQRFLNGVLEQAAAEGSKADIFTDPGAEVAPSDTGAVRAQQMQRTRKVEQAVVEAQRTRQLLQSLREVCQRSSSSNDLLSKMLTMLTQQGPFSRAAVVVLDAKQQRALLHRVSGDGFTPGQVVNILDPLSPLVFCSAEIKSYNSAQGSTGSSPFGVSAYAFARLSLEFDLPILLYADCGRSKPISMAVRKFFREAVKQLNETLPSLGVERVPAQF